jgi:hypothetical protein
MAMIPAVFHWWYHDRFHPDQPYLETNELIVFHVTILIAFAAILPLPKEMTPPVRDNALFAQVAAFMCIYQRFAAQKYASING